MKSWLAIAMIGLCVLPLQPDSAKQPHISAPAAPVDSAQIKALVQAIQDEIYADNLQVDDYDAGVPTGKGACRLELYVQPDFNEQGLAWAIYKLMPYGEVLRMFWIGGSGTAFLYGKPTDRFRPTGPSYLTAYMGDGELLRAKQTWTRTHFSVDLRPSAENLRESKERQKKRRAMTRSVVSASDVAADYKDSQRAADESATGADPTGGATHYFLDFGQPQPIWAVGAQPLKTFGPFLKTLEDGKTQKAVKVKIVIIR
ncbi:MAG TPA: hypothetical protein VN785_08965 [Candidatus Angelobacter sp.]|nr:hypothetical protein [Candidatus Angelobacter sp.]